jgi:hypothetical protein
MATRTRNRELDTSAPILRHGKIVEVTPTEREEKFLFPILDPHSGRDPWSYDMLPRDYLAALLPDTDSETKLTWSDEYLRRRLRELSHEPNNYLRIPEMQANNRYRRGRFGIYCHPETALNEDEFWHDLLPQLMAAQIEIGVAQRPDLQIVNYERILNAPSTPKNCPLTWTIEIPRPYITLKNGITKPAKPWHVTPDWQIFGVGKTDNIAFRWYVLEADKGTEPMTSGSKRKSVLSMLKRALEIDRLDLAKIQFGRPRFHFLMIFSTPARMQSAMELLAEETDGLGHPRIIFGTFPVYNSFRDPIPPDGSWFRRAFTRVAGVDSKKVKATWSDEFKMDEL